MAAKDPEDVKMSLGEHLEELRKRLILGLVGPLVIAVAALFFGGQILTWLMRPALVALRSQGLPTEMISTDVGATFGLYMKVALLAGLILGIPWLLYQLWLFIAPGLYKGERKIVHRLIPGSALLAVLGVLFMYYMLLPIMLIFLIGFALDVPPPNLDLYPWEKLFFSVPTVTFVPTLGEDPKYYGDGDVWVKTPESELRIATGGRVVRVEKFDGGELKFLPDPQRQEPPKVPVVTDDPRDYQAGDIWITGIGKELRIDDGARVLRIERFTRSEKGVELKVLPALRSRHFPRVPVLDRDPPDRRVGDMWVNLPDNQLRIDTGSNIVHARLSRPSIITPMPDVKELFDFTLLMALAFAISFQLPLVMFVIAWAGIVDRKQLAGIRKYAFLGCIVLAAVITPGGDPISLTALTLPLYGLYELGILLVWLFVKPTKEDGAASVAD